MPTHFDDYEKHAQWLEKIANTLETNTPEFFPGEVGVQADQTRPDSTSKDVDLWPGVR
jgi:hypothetical protein